MSHKKGLMMKTTVLNFKKQQGRLFTARREEVRRLVRGGRHRLVLLPQRLPRSVVARQREENLPRDGRVERRGAGVQG